MAQILSIKAMSTPTDGSLSGLANPCPVQGIPVSRIQNISPLSATQATQFPAGNSQITVSYYSANNVQTGAYIAELTVAQAITNSNA